jgi:hypothetical protein
MTEFEFFNLSYCNSNYFEFLHVCRHVLNTPLMMSDMGCHISYANDLFSP